MRQGQFSNLWKFRKARQVRGEVGWWVNVPELNCNVFPSPRKPKLHTDKVYKTFNSFSILCGCRDGRGAWGRMDTCISIAESLHCSPQTIANRLYPNTK